MSLKIKRVYEKPSRNDGTRVLVDRVWPRGLSKADAAIDEWRKEVAPSTALRKWFGHASERWQEFKRRYFAELKKQNDALDELRRLSRGKTVTLLFGAKDTEHNQAIALKEYLGTGGK